MESASIIGDISGKTIRNCGGESKTNSGADNSH